MPVLDPLSTADREAQLDAALQPLLNMCSGYPDFAVVTERFPSTEDTSWWGVFLKIAFPVPGALLPILWSVESGFGPGGIAAVIARQKREMEDGTAKDAFAMYWRANRDKYRLYFQSIMTLPNHNTHDTGDMAKAHEWGCNMSRGLLAAIFGSDPRTTDNRLTATDTPVAIPCNRINPLFNRIDDPGVGDTFTNIDELPPFPTCINQSNTPCGREYRPTNLPPLSDGGPAIRVRAVNWAIARPTPMLIDGTFYVDKQYLVYKVEDFIGLTAMQAIALLKGTCVRVPELS